MPAAATGTSRTVTVWPWGSSTSCGSRVDLGLGDGADVGGGQLQRLAQLRVERRQRRSAAAPDRPAATSGGCSVASKRAVSRSTASSPPSTHLAARSRSTSTRAAPTRRPRRGSRPRSRAAPSHSKRRALIAPSPPAASRSARRPRAARSLWATRLATKRAVHSTISSRTSRSFSSRVRPVATRSTMPSARPISGASSTEPLTSITSTWRPVASKWRSAIRGYLVAIRIIPRRRCGLAQPARRPCARRAPCGSGRSRGRAARRRPGRPARAARPCR